MKRILIIIILLSALGGLVNNANSQNFLWAKQMGGTNIDQSFSIAVDINGNVYTTGIFSGTADFDPGLGTYYLTSAGNYDIFVSKLDPSGNFLWAKQLGGAVLDYVNSIAVDSSGNVYTTGYFKDTADFDPGIGTYYLISDASYDIFVSKLDASGNFVWAKQMGGISNDEVGYSIAVDVGENAYTTGFFNGTADFDPGTGTYNLTSAGNYPDIFVSKLDASGNFLWAKQLGGTDADWGFSIAVDTSGNVYTTGTFVDTADFDPGTGTYNLTSAGNADVFISKLDAFGNFLWAKRLGGINGDTGYSIAVDATGNVYTTGTFSGTADFDPGIGTYNLTSAGGNDIFVSKLDASGNFLWAKQLGGVNNADGGYSIAVDATGNVYTTGIFIDTADFDPGMGIYNLISAGLTDIFVSKLDTAGNFLWAKQMGGTNTDAGSSIEVDASGNVYATGYFNVTADFDPSSGTYNMTSTGADDIFVVKLGNTTGITENSNSNDIVNIFPNPGNGHSNIISSGIIDEIKITNLLGQIIFQTKPNENAFSFQLDAAGIYFIQITTDKQSITKKLIVSR
ncbi:MAG: SBBP repeat-containing protein [Bacteroidia bacterium]